MDDMRDSFSKLKKKIKHKITGRQRKQDRTGPDAHGERADPTGSLPRPEPRVAASDGHDRDGNGTDAGGRQIRSTDRAPQLESLPAGGSDNDRQRGEVDVHGTEVSQRSSRLDSDAEVAVTVGSRRSRELERVYPSSSTSVPHSGNPDST